MKKSIIIEARMNSSRLPGKHCYKVYGKNIIEYLIKRLKKVKYAPVIKSPFAINIVANETSK